MKRQWKPGDVALVDSWRGDDQLAIRVKDGTMASWCVLDGTDTRGLDDEEVRAARPLVVIDPEDREQIERLAALLHNYDAHLSDDPHRESAWASLATEALREFADPKPPKPEEPLGIGAVVENANGRLWVRIDEAPRYAWRRLDGVRAHYSDIAVVRVLSDGWAGEDA